MLVPSADVTSPLNEIVILPVPVALQVTDTVLEMLSALAEESAAEVLQPDTGPDALILMFQAATPDKFAFAVKDLPTVTDELLTESEAPPALALILKPIKTINVNII